MRDNILTHYLLFEVSINLFYLAASMYHGHE